MLPLVPAARAPPIVQARSADPADVAPVGDANPMMRRTVDGGWEIMENAQLPDVVTSFVTVDDLHLQVRALRVFNPLLLLLLLLLLTSIVVGTGTVLAGGIQPGAARSDPPV